MPDAHIFNTVTIRWSEDARFPGIGIKILESRTTHPSVSLVIVQLGTGGVINTHVHPVETETAYVLAGRGLLTHGDQETVLETGMGVTIPAGLPHGLRNIGDTAMELIAIHSPPTR
jgi:quercetin dioxygenase-like cupin family protein